MELQQHTPVLVGIETLAFGADHDRCLRRQDARIDAVESSYRPPGRGFLHARKSVAVRRLRADTLKVVVRRDVVREGNQIFIVEIADADRMSEVVGQLKPPPRHDEAVIAGGLPLSSDRLDGFDTAAGLPLPLFPVAVRILARIVVPLQLLPAITRPCIRARIDETAGTRVHMGHGLEVGGRLAYVRGRDLLNERPRSDPVRLLRAGFVLVRHLGAFAIDGRLLARRIGDNQLVLRRRVLVPVAQPHVFPAAVDIVVVVLAELARHRHFGVLLTDLPLPNRQRAVIREDRRGLATDALIQEQPVVLAKRQIPGPRAHLRFVKNDASVGSHEPEREDVTVEMTVAAVVAQQFHRNELADEVIRIELGVIRQDLDHEAEIARERFLAFEAIHQQHLVRGIAIRERQRQQPTMLHPGGDLSKILDRQVCIHWQA